MKPIDTLGRPLRDLRISVTDRCNFRCTYCMPKEVFGRDYEFLPRESLLSYEEIALITDAATRLGVTKVRLTGGEPLMRRDLSSLVEMLDAIDGVDDLTLTTNGALLAKSAPELAAAGLDRVTVSLDSLRDETFMAMNDVGFPVASVLSGIEAASEAGLGPVKVNVVVKRGVNDQEVAEIAAHFRGTGHIVRFIEFMDVGTTNGWRLDDVVSADKMLAAIGSVHPIEALPANYPGEVASRYRYTDGSGEVGVIASVTRPFCGGCTRLRLSAEGSLYTCLFAGSGTDLHQAVRSGADIDEITALMSGVWGERSDRYSEIRSSDTTGWERVEMSYIGG